MVVLGGLIQDEEQILQIQVFLLLQFSLDLLYIHFLIIHLKQYLPKNSAR